MLCLAFALSILPVFSTKSKLDNCSDKLLRLAELKGSTELVLKIEELKEETNLDFTVSFDGTEYMVGTNKVQLGDDIQITLGAKKDIGFYNFGSFPIAIKSKAFGTSEVYHK